MHTYLLLTIETFVAMKKVLLLMTVMLCCMISMAQTKYRVTAKSSLNVRSYASAQAPVLSSIDRGEVVEVYEIENGWAKIEYEGTSAYISAKYIERMETAESKPEMKDAENVLKYLSVGKGDVKWMVYLIISLSAVLLYMRIRRGDEPLEDGEYWTNCSVFTGLCLAELAYVMMMGSNSIWFCMPDTVGWIWTIVDFLIFGFVVYNQIMCFFNTLQDTEYNSYGSFDKRWGIYSWIGGIVAAIVVGIFWGDKVVFVLGAFAICQLIQIYLIFKGVVPRGGWLRAFVCLTVYLLGSLATVLVLAHFVVLLIIVVIGYIILSAIGHGSSGRTGSCSQCGHYSGGYCSYRHCHIYDADRKTCDHYY